MKEANYECDDRDDDERGVLKIHFAGNHDWYATVHYADEETAEEKWTGLPPSVRFRTSGGSHPTVAILCIAILYDIGTGDMVTALDRAKALVEQLSPRAEPEEA